MKIAKIIAKILLYAIGGIVGFVVVLLLSINFLLQSTTFTGFVLGKVLPGVEESLGADIHVEKLSLSLFPVTVRIEGVHFTPAKGEFRRKFAELGKLEIDTSFWPLLKGQVVVDRVLIDGVSNYLYFDENGLANLPIPPSPEEPEEPSTGPPDLKLPITVKSIEIRNTRFAMDMDTDPAAPGLETEVAIDSIGLDARADFNTGDTHAELRIAQGSWRAGTMADTLERLDLDADFSLKKWGGEVTKLEIRVPDVELNAKAVATDVMTTMKIVADLDGNVQLRKVNTLVTPEPKLDGALGLSIHAEAPLPNYSASGEIRLPDGRVNELALNDMKLLFAVDQDKATVKELFLRAAGGEIKVGADLGLKGAMPLDANVSLTNLNVGRAMEDFGIKGTGVAATLTGDVNTHGQLGGEGAEMSLENSVSLAIANVAYQDLVRIPKVGVQVDAGYTPKGVRLDHAEVTTAKTRIAADGKVALPEVGLALSFLVDAKDLSEFSPIMGKPIAGSVHVQGKVAGSASNPNLDVGLDIKNVRYDTFGVDSVNGKVAMEGKKLAVKNLVIRNKAAVIEATADVNLAGSSPTIVADVKIPSAEIGDLLAIAGQSQLDVAGKIGLTAKISGPANKLTGDTNLTITELKAYGENVKSIALVASLEGGAVNLKDLSIVKLAPPRPDDASRADAANRLPQDQWNEIRIQAKGGFDPATGKLQLDLASAGLNERSSDILRKQEVPLVADIDLKVAASGSVKDPEAKVHLGILNARFDNMALGDSVIDVDLKNMTATVKGSLLAGRENVKLSAAETTREGEWAVRRYNSKSDKSETPVAPGASPELAPTDTTVSSAEDVLDHPEDFTTPVPPPVSADPARPLGDIKIDIVAQLDGAKNVKGQVKFDKFDYTNFLGALKSREDTLEKKKKKDDEEEKASIVEGRINGVIDLDGTLAAPDAIRIATNLDELYFRKNRLIIRNQNDAGVAQPLLVTYQNKQLAIENFQIGGKGLHLDVNQGGGLINVDLRADMSVAQEFADALAEAKGQLVVQASLPDNFDATQAKALVTVDNASFAMRGVPTPVDHVNVRIAYANNRVEIDRLDARIGGGSLRGGGDIALADPKLQDDITRMRVFIKADSIKTGMDPYVELAVRKIDLAVQTIDRGANRGKMEVSGEVVVDKAVVTYPIDVPYLFKQLSEFGRQKESSGRETYEKKEDSIFFNIALRADGDVGFMSNLAEIETRFDLVLVGSNAQPGMKGSVDVVKGWAMVLQNTYDLSNVTIQFYDEQRIFPSFDVNAKTEVKGTKIFVNVAGNPIRYKMTLSSDPPKGERDIFFLLATGASYDDFQAQGSGMSGDEAAALAAQSLVGNQLSKLTGQSGFEVGIDSSSGTSRLQVGSELEKDLNLKMYRGLVDQTLGAEIEYDFYRYVAGLGSWSNMAGYEDAPPSGAFGTGLKLKVDFQ
ncbi:MAG: translocation/assembly module TamB domain-containing protein [Deltaproteobacteria bacterium]|nr:translocation/assembly module TamB domain-containing protein [Deltaproteobacteria bacterium]